jgi:glutathione peroxidase
MDASLSKIEFKTSAGEPTTLAQYDGKVLLIVNVASKCGLTPQYDALEALFEKYSNQGFSVLGFPANEFGNQEPGTNAEIQEFCRMNFGVQFPVFEKIVVKGEGQHPLYKTLTQSIPVSTKKPGGDLEENLAKHGVVPKPGEILWNFEKFLVNRQGKVMARFAPDVEPNDPLLVSAIEKEIARD